MAIRKRDKMNKQDKKYQKDTGNNKKEKLDPNNGKKTEKTDMIDWIFQDIFWNFIPIITCIIISFITSQNGSIDMSRLIGEGEIIFTSFSIAASSVIKLSKMDICNKNGKNKFIFYVLICISLCELITYVAVKVSMNNTVDAVYMASVFCVISSIMLSGIGEKLYNEGKVNE